MSSSANTGGLTRVRQGVNLALVGRSPELGSLERCLLEAVAGRPQLILIPGAPGIGKTRLLSELRDKAHHGNFTVGAGRGYEDLAFPYLSFAEALGPLVDDLPTELKARLEEDLEVVRPILRGSASAAPAPDLPVFAAGADDVDRARVRLFLAVSRVAVCLAQRQVTLITLDDLHWADSSSLELLCHLVYAVSSAATRQSVPLMIVASYRPPEPGAPLAHIVNRLEREEICSRLELGSLDERDVTEMIHALGQSPPSRQLVTTINDTARGNPLFIQEIFDHLDRRGALAVRAGSLWTETQPSELRLPADITTAMSGRADALSEGCRELLRLASCLGNRFSLRELGAVSGRTEGELLALLEEGIDQGVVAAAKDAFEFAHPLMRHVFYGQPNELRRQLMHLQIADALQELYAGEIEPRVLEIAHHFISAGPRAKAERVLEYAQLAGDRAFALCAWADAARYCRAALDASTGNLGDAERATLHFRTGLAHYRDADAASSLDHYEQAAQLFERARDIGGLAQVLMEQTRVRITVAPVSYGSVIDVGALEEAVGKLDDEPLRGRIFALLAQVYWTARDPQQALASAKQSLEIAERGDEPGLRSEAWEALALAQNQTLRVRDAAQSQREALRCARVGNDLWQESYSLQRLPLTLVWRGELDDADAIAREACALTSRTHSWAGHSLALAARVSVAVARGNSAAAQELSREVMLMAERARYPWGAYNALPALACSLFWQGRWQEAEDAVAALAEPGKLFEEPGPAIQLMGWLYGQLMRVRSGVSDEMRQQLVSGLGRMETPSEPEVGAVPAICAVVEIGNLLEAPELMDAPYRQLSLARSRGMMFSSGWVFLLPRVLGVAAAVLRSWEDAEKHFSEAISVAKRLGARPELARSCFDHAHMLTARGSEGDRDRAIDLLMEAHGLFAELGMRPLERSADELGARLGLVTPLVQRLEPVGSAGLSVGERVLLRSATSGDAGATPPDLTDVLQRIGLGRPAAEPPSTDEDAPPLILLMTDMEGFTELIQRQGARGAQEVIHTHNTILRDCLRDHIGTEIQHTGDGIFASFLSAARAVACAIAMQRELARHNREHPDSRIKIRVGLAAGAPVPEEGRLLGPSVNAAARICAHALGGQIVTSRDVVRFAGDVNVTDLGEVPLKGFKEPFHLQAIQW